MLAALLPGVRGFIFPNEAELQWSILIVLYPYLTGLVAGAFILASLVRVFHVRALQPVYRLALLTALAFLLVAPLPLQLHLGHPERSYEMYLTPHTSSAMAMFGFVYLWYLLGVLVLEIWLDYRREIVLRGREARGPLGLLYRLMALGVDEIGEASLRLDDRLGRFITVLGIPSAFLLHGYVGFIFGSLKANPWWSTPMMPIVFLFSAIVSGIAAVLGLYLLSARLRRVPVRMDCADAMGRFLLYAFLVDFALEGLDLLHRIYEADESFKSLDFMVHTQLFTSQILIQIFLGGLLPIGMLALPQVFTLTERARKGLYGGAAALTLIGIFAMRWNVVIGGQLFSKSFLGYTTYKLDFATREGLLPAVALLILPLGLLWFLQRLLPPWEEAPASPTGLPGEPSPPIGKAGP